MKRNVHFSRNVSIFTEFKEGRFFFLKKIQKNYISLEKIVYSNDCEVLKKFLNKYETLNNFLKETTTKNKIWKFQKDFLTIQVIGKYIYI
jgi:hypothetical protein